MLFSIIFTPCGISEPIISHRSTYVYFGIFPDGGSLQNIGETGFTPRKSSFQALRTINLKINSLARVPLIYTLPSFSFDRISVLLSLCALPLGIYSRPVSGLSPFLLSTISSNFKNTSNRGCANDPNFIPRKKWNYRILKKIYDHGLFFSLNHIVGLNSQNYQNFLFGAQIDIFVEKGTTSM